MTRLSYENFDLLILLHGDRYQARVIDSPAGQATVIFDLPLRANELRSFPWLAGARGSHLVRNVIPAETTAPTEAALIPKRFGERLFHTAFADDVGKLLVRSRDLAEAKGKAMRIRLRIDRGAAALADLPWEYLYVPDWQRFPALSDHTPIVRYLELPQPVRPLRATQPLRILAVVSNPKDAVPLRVEEEWAHLQSATTDLQEEGMVVLERLTTPTLRALQNRLREIDVHILHFIGHGHFAPEQNEGSLLFENDQGLAQQVTAEQLATLLHDEELRLVFLNACEGARSDADDAFAGVAQMLVQQGVAAVLAMQFAVSDRAAIALAHEFYQALADGYGVDTAVSEARKALYALDNGGDEQRPVEWGTPVLYMRAADGRIFAMNEDEDRRSSVTWRLQGIGALAAGLLGVVSLIGLVYLLLDDFPMAQGSLAVMGAVLAFVIGLLGLREERTLFPRLSHWVGKRRPVQVGLVTLLAVGIILWGTVGIPKIRCGPLGCPPAGVRYYAIGNWENLTPGISSYERIWTEGTRRTLYEKLNRVNALQGVSVDDPQVAAAINRYVGLWIEGAYQQIEEVQLSANLAERRGLVGRPVTVRKAIDEAAPGIQAEILALQNRLAEEILAALEINVSPEEMETVRKTPTDNEEAFFLNNTAVVMVDQNRELEEAEQRLREAIRLDPTYASPHNNLGRLLYGRGDFINALLEQQQAIALAPNNPLYHFNLGLTLERLGDYDGAVVAYERAIELDPSYVKAFNNLGFTYLLQGEWQNARDALERGLDLNPDAAYLHKNLGRVYLDQGDAAQAAAELQRAIDLYTDGVYAEALFYLAQAHQAQNALDAACQTLQQYQAVANEDRRLLDGRARADTAQELFAQWQCP